MVALAGVGFGTQSILAKVAYDGGADVPTVLAARFLVAAAAILVVVRVWGGPDAGTAAELGLRRRLGFALLGLIFVASALLAYLALARLPAGTTTLLVFVYPALVVLWSRLLFGERLTRRRATALLLALAGCALVVDPAAALAAGAGLSWAGVGLALGSAVSNSWYMTIAGPLGRGVPGIVVAAHSLPVTAACFAVGLLLLGGPIGGVTAAGWLACLALGVLAAASTVAFLAGVALIGPSRAAITATSEPAAAVALGALLLGEPLTLLGLLGGLCIVAAIVLLARGQLTEAGAPAMRRVRSTGGRAPSPEA